MKNIFVVGHGFQCSPETEFKVYPKCAVTFYCRDGAMFDSQWEDVVMARVRAGRTPAESDIQRAKDEWEVTSYGPTTSAQCKNYIITRPGGIALKVPFKDSKPIATDLSGKVSGIDDADDGETLCIKNGGGNDTSAAPYTNLNSLLHWISRRGLDMHVHWLACRSPFPDGGIGAIISQAKSYPSLRK